MKELVSLQEQLDTVVNEKPENSLGEESVMRHEQEDSSSKSEDVMSSENGSNINPVDLKNQTEGGSILERAEFLEANPIDEAASVKIMVEAAESFVDEGVKSAQGPTTEDEDEKSANPIDEAASVEIGVEVAESSVDESVKSAQCSTAEDEYEKSNEVLENNETSIAKADREAVILGQGSKLFSPLDDSSALATDLAQNDDHETFQSELAELPQGVLDDLCAAESMDHPAVEADSSKADQSHKRDEVFTGSPIVDEENHQAMGTHGVSDLPLDRYELEPEKTGKCGSLAKSNKSETEEKEDSKVGDAASEPIDCTVQQLIADKIEPFDASEGENIPTNHESHENSGITDPATEVPPTLNEMSGQLLQEGNMEETGLTNEHTSSCDAASMVGTKSAAAVEQGAADINHSRGVSEMGLLSKQGEEWPKEDIEKQELEDAAKNENNNGVGDEMRESYIEVIEEKERLREMVEKLIKSGQEQLTAISSLSGRVKDLEKKLSRKKKLKVRQFRAPRSKFDGYGALGVAM